MSKLSARALAGEVRLDPRVARSRAALLEAGRRLFLRQGYAGTTMEEIAAEAGLTKRTVYNNFADKEALFRHIVADTVVFADAFVAELEGMFAGVESKVKLRELLDDLALRMARAIVRPQVIELRCLLIGEAKQFPALAAEYFERAPGRVIEVLATRFRALAKSGLLSVKDARQAAAQFSYLVIGESLDRAMLTGKTPTARRVQAAAREGVATFVARYGVGE